MTHEEISEILLLTLYENGPQSSVSKALLQNSLPSTGSNPTQISTGLISKGLLKQLDPSEPDLCSLTTNGFEVVEKKLKTKYEDDYLSSKSLEQLINSTGFGKGTYDIIFEVDGKYGFTVNLAETNAFFKLEKVGHVYRLISNPSKDNTNPTTPSESLDRFNGWLKELKGYLPPKTYQKFALSVLERDSNFERIGFKNQGLIGYLLTNKSEFTVPLYEFTSKDVPNSFFYNTSLERESALKFYDAGKTIGHGYTSPMGEDTIELKRYGLENSTLLVTNPLEDIPFSDETTIFQPPIHLLKKQKEGTVPIYVYSNIPDQRYFEPLPTNQNKVREREPENLNEVVTLQGDGSTKDDKLLREPFINALKSHIDKYWDEAENLDSYTIHLDGEWGSGKSSILDMLEPKLQEDGWAVVRYNAWQNQHLEKPWWVFLYKVYQKTLSSEPIEFRRMRLQWYNFKWKVLSPNKAVILSIGIIVFALFIIVRANGFDWIFAFEPTAEATLKLVTLLISVFGGLWVASNFIVNTILSGSSKPEDSFYKKLSDPMDSFKSYFKNIVSITSKKTAIFIDDLDRCREGTTVGLLEGIQTLFKDQKVLYIIAGDGQWISTCFEVHYSAFKHDKAGHSLGDSFLAKVFQMSTAVPTMSPEAKGQYLRHLLNIDTPSNQSVKNSNEITDEIEQATSETELSNIIQVNKNKANVNQQALRISASEKLSGLDLKKDISHVLIEHENDLEPNARSIKRFINNYSLARNALFLEGKTLADISQQSLIKWLIVSSRWPSYSYALKKNPNELDNIKNKDFVFNEYAKGWLTVDLLQKLS